MTDEELNAKIEAANARLDAREDPPPAPTLPPQTATTLFDARIVIETVVEDGKEVAKRWRVYDGEGKELPAQAIASVLFAAADMIANSEGWAQPLWRAARAVVAAVQRGQPGPQVH